MIEGYARPRVAEFFAGIGLVRMAIEEHGLDVVWANDIERDKLSLYAKNFDARDFVLGDIRDIRGVDVPDVDLATASFPCTDLSLAGNRVGLRGEQSGLFWEFSRVTHGHLGDKTKLSISNDLNVVDAINLTHTLEAFATM